MPDTNDLRNHDNMIRYRNLMGRCKKEAMENYVKNDDKFVEFFIKMSIETQIRDQ